MATKKDAEVKVETVEVEPKTEKKVKEPKTTEEFIARKLKVINEMEDKAKARRLAERVLANRK